jgi:DNA-binding response OmpR family regulator
MSDPPSSPPSVARSSTSSPTTVFIADDDDLQRGVLRRVLEAEGYEVVEASNGADALLFLASAADGERPLPDVLILDVGMPGLSGLGVLRALSRFERAPPTLVVTGFRDPSVELVARRFGALRLMHKPLDLEEVCAAVLEAASRSRSPAPSREAQ